LPQYEKNNQNKKLLQIRDKSKFLTKGALSQLNPVFLYASFIKREYFGVLKFILLTLKR
jgi:hypothetical protein